MQVFMLQTVHRTLFHFTMLFSVEFRRNLLSRDLRYSLFHLFANWSGHFNLTFGAGDKR